MMSEDTIIETSVRRITTGFTKQRIMRINEALAFSKGTFDNQERHVVSVLPDGKEAYFLKPGKEAKRRQNPNPNDMLPCVEGTTSEKYSFAYIWGYLVEISFIDQELFRKVLVLLYRLCYFLDHQENEVGKLRYKPSKEMQKCIDKMNKSIMKGFEKKLKTDCPELMEFLHMIDMIGWNEDVKYHVCKLDSSKKKRTGMLSSENVKYVPSLDSSKKKRIGVPNMVLSVISVPLEINDFIKNATDTNSIVSVMYRISKSRGICALSDTKLREYLSSYLSEKPV